MQTHSTRRSDELGIGRLRDGRSTAGASKVQSLSAARQSRQMVSSSPMTHRRLRRRQVSQGRERLVLVVFDASAVVSIMQLACHCDDRLKVKWAMTRRAQGR